MSFFRKTNKKFGEIAVKKGLVTNKQIEAALKEQEAFKQKGEVHKRIGSILVEKGVLDIEDVDVILKEQYKNSIFVWLGAFFSLK